MHRILEPDYISKSGLYTRIMVLWLVMIFLIMVVTEIDEITSGSIRFGEYVAVITIVLALLVNIFFVFLLRLMNYSRSILIIAIFYALIVAPGFSALPGFITYGSVVYKVIFSCAQATHFTFYIFVIVVIMKDIFETDETRTYHLWGAVISNIYLLLSFGMLYRIISLWYPQAIQQSFENGLIYLYACMTFSLNAATGMDYLYPVSPLFQKIANFENWIMNLYLIIILGRLLSVPIRKINTRTEHGRGLP